MGYAALTHPTILRSCLDTPPRSRGAMRPRFASNAALEKREGAGKTGCALHPRSRVQRVKESAHEPTGSAEASRPSLRNGLRLMPRSPRRSGFACHRRRREVLLPAGMMPTLRRQDHTFSPSAITWGLVSRSFIASTASHRAFVTIAIRPSHRVKTGVQYKPDFSILKIRILLHGGLDGLLGDLPVGLFCRGRDGKILLAREAKQFAFA